MHHVRLLLASALLMVGCAADDSPGTWAGATTVPPVPSAEEPASDSAPDGTASETAPVASGSPDDTASGTAPVASGSPDDTASETAPVASGSPDDTASETAPVASGSPDDTASETAPAAEAPDDAPARTAGTAPDETSNTVPAPPAAEAPADERPTIENPTTGTPSTAAPTTAAPTTAAPTTASTTAAPTTAAPTTAAPTTAPQPSVDGSVVFYEATCDVCHGADGRGGSGADLSESTLDLDAVIEVVRFGVDGTEMEGWDFEPKPPGLTRSEIEAVAAYVMTLRAG